MYSPDLSSRFLSLRDLSEMQGEGGDTAVRNLS